MVLFEHMQHRLGLIASVVADLGSLPFAARHTMHGSYSLLVRLRSAYCNDDDDNPTAPLLLQYRHFLSLLLFHYDQHVCSG